MKRPEEVTLTREDGEALIERLEKDALTAEDRRSAPDLGTRAARIDFLYYRV